MSDLFLSHSSADVALARELRSRLEASGYSCFTAPDDVTGRRSWTEQIVEAIDGCRLLMVLISGESIRSPHVSKEVGLAIDRGKPVMPVRIEDVILSGSLAYLLHLVQWVDAFPGPIDRHAELIRQRVDSILEEERSAGRGLTEAVARPPDAGPGIAPPDPNASLSNDATGEAPTLASTRRTIESDTVAGTVVADQSRVPDQRGVEGEAGRRRGSRAAAGTGGRMALTPLRIGVALAAGAVLLGLGFIVGTFLIP